MTATAKHVRRLDKLDNKDVPSVSGKNPSLGEMIQSLKEEGVRVPGGFATTADAYREFLKVNDLEKKINGELDKLSQIKQPLDQTGKTIRKMFRSDKFPEAVAEAIRTSYRQLSDHGCP